jgi:uncharacterized phage-like protein YoqJ
MRPRDSTICFTGHRPDKLGGYHNHQMHDRVREMLRKTIAGLAELVTEPHFITGMALGVDQWAARILIDMGLPFTAAVPCPNQSERWPKNSQIEYNFILARAAHIETISPTYTPDCMHKRNKWMVDHSSIVIAVWDGSDGGTAHCVRYAERADHTPVIVRIEPQLAANADAK